METMKKITCWIVRLRISHALDTLTPLPRSVARHADRCRACRRFLRAGSPMIPAPSIERHLIPSSADWERLARQIMESAGTAAAHRKPRRRWPRPAAAALAAAAAVTILIMLWSFFPEARPVDLEDGRDRTAAVTPSDRDPQDSTASNRAPGQRREPLIGHLRDPLSVELERLKNDASSAGHFLITFLALGFVPPEQDNTAAIR